MAADGFYKTAKWAHLRRVALRRDLWTCVVPDCEQLANAVDHIVARRAGGADTLENLRSLCSARDHAIKEGRGGRRGSESQLNIKGCYPDGSPRVQVILGGGRSNRRA